MSLAEVLPSVAAHAEARAEGGALIIELSGRWQLEDGAPRFDRVISASATNDMIRERASDLAASTLFP